MFGLFQDAPTYQAQPNRMRASSGGGFGFLGGLFALSTTPTYATAPSLSTSTGMPAQAIDLGGGCRAVIAEPACTVPMPIAIVVQRPAQ
jgi:hypothetical protein